MHDFLHQVIANKESEVNSLKTAQAFERKSLKNALSNGLGVIAEIKRASPALGDLADIQDPVMLAKQYVHAGASAISVLTDQVYFKGSMDDLKSVSSALVQSSCPILRKDFIIDKIQIEQSKKMGADAILLIVAVLQEKTQAMIDIAHFYCLEVLLEVHTLDELKLALKTNADVLGINNRNLSTFDVDIQTSVTLKKHLPKERICVSESGIHDVKTAHLLYACGYHGLLIGEALVRADNPVLLIRSIQGVL